jgi:hypothetical protein
MKYSAGMGSVAMIYIPSFIKICSGLTEVRTYRHTESIEILNKTARIKPLANLKYLKRDKKDKTNPKQQQATL